MDSLPLQLFIQVLLIAINAFFAASEIAIISLNKIKLKKRVEEGDKKAVRLLKLAEMPDKFLSTIQIGITLAGFLGSAFAADTFSEMLVNLIYEKWGFTQLPINVLDTLCVILITIILSYFTLVFGELVPKRIAMKKTDLVAKITVNVVYYISVVMSPVIWFLAKSCNLVLRIFGIKSEENDEQVTEEEIQLMVDSAEETGAIENVEHKWISNVFEFNDKAITKIMTPAQDVMFITEDMTYSAITAFIKENRYTRIPYCKTGLNDIIGILNIKDFFTLEFDNIDEIIKKPFFVSEFMLADDLFKCLQKNKSNIAIVIDEFGNTIGIVTMEDLLEEIVGDIYDEDDESDDNIIKIDENTFEANGNITVNEIEKLLDIEIEDANFDTLGGMIFSKIDYVPDETTDVIVEAYGYRFTVLDFDKKRINRVKIEKILNSV